MTSDLTTLCAACGGTKEIPCQQCKGSGSYPYPTRQVCSRCKGRCKEPCPNCCQDEPKYPCPGCGKPMTVTRMKIARYFSLDCKPCDIHANGCGWDATEEAIAAAHGDLGPDVEAIRAIEPTQDAARELRREFENVWNMLDGYVPREAVAIRKRFLDNWRKLAQGITDLAARLVEKNRTTITGRGADEPAEEADDGAE